MDPPKAANCAGCGAPLPVSLYMVQYRCAFCGREQLVGPPQAPTPPVHYPHQPPQPPHPPAHQPASRKLWMALIPLAVTVAMGLSATAFFASSRAGSKAGSTDTKASPGRGGVVPAGEHLQWDSWARSLAVADINRDGIEDFVGRYKILDISAGTQTTYAGAFDGKTFARIWKSAPLGTHSQSINATFVGIAADRAVVSDYRSTVQILELTTGKPLVNVQLSDRAQAICSPPPGIREVWVKVADNRHVTIDVSAGRATLSPMPDWCKATAGRECGSRGGNPHEDEACATDSQDYAKYQAAGFSQQRVLRNDGLMIVMGTKSPGTAVPIAAGVDPKTKNILWQQPIPPNPAAAQPGLPDSANLIGGRLYTSYTPTEPRQAHLVAFDAKTGARIFDVPIPRSDSGSDADSFLVTSTRIYVPHWTWLDIFDARTGTYIQTVGIW